MTFDLVVTISMHFYERCSQQKKKMYEISDLRRREILLLRSVCPFVPQGGGGCILIFSYIHRPMLFFGFKTLNFNNFGGFQKTEYLWEYEDFVDIFWGHHKIGLYLEVISMHLRVKVPF